MFIILLKFSDNMMTTGEVPLLNDYEIVETNLFVREEEEFKPDALLDDLAMIIRCVTARR